jgi:Polyketide cyclase / dehydrase and lipid transport
MKPVTVSIDVPQPPQQVYDFLDVLANHEPFTNHFLTNWRYAGPDRGVGARATVTSTLAGRAEVAFEVVEAEPPRRIAEQNTSAKGRRVARGTYVLEPLPGGGTRVRFEYAWLRAPVTDRVLEPVARAVLRRANQSAMRRLAGQLASTASPPTT